MKRSKWYSIYCYQNIKKDHPRRGWYYVGRTQGESRIRSHRGEGLLGEDLQAFPDSVICSVIWTGICTPEEIDKKEKYYIQECNCVSPNGYNLNHGGGGVIQHTKEEKQRRRIMFAGENNPMFGKHHSEETKQKMRKPHPSTQGDNNPMKKPEVRRRHKEVVGRLDIREKVRKGHLGKKLSSETIEKIRKSMFGDGNPVKRLQVREKMSKTHQGMKHSNETKVKMCKSQQERWKK